jgi:alpha-tubulin suppressor-like RCC1 family protein
LKGGFFKEEPDMRTVLVRQARSLVHPQLGVALALAALGASTMPACGPVDGDASAPFEIQRVSSPVVLSASKVYQSGMFGCAILNGGAVKCWGWNSSGQCGAGNTNQRGDNPNEMGNNLPFVDLGSGRTATALALGADFACAILDNAKVKCWGNNLQGRLGLGAAGHRGDGPNEMGDNLPYVDLGTNRTAKAIAAGYTHACAILNDNTLKCWGGNAGGQLGLGDTNHRGDVANEMGDLLPIVPLGTGRTAKAISIGAYTTCAILDNNTLKCWGGNQWGQCGQGNTTQRGDQPNELGDALLPVALGTGRTVKKISADWRKTCAILDNNKVKCWGYPSGLGIYSSTVVGDGPGEMGDALPYVDLGVGRTAVTVAGTGEKACALLDNATVKCWGTAGGAWGLGYGNMLNKGTSSTPGSMGNALLAVDLGAGLTVTALSGGGYSLAASFQEAYCAVLSNGSTKCWGPNFFGQLGIEVDNQPRGDGPPSEMGNTLPALNFGTTP